MAKKFQVEELGPLLLEELGAIIEDFGGSLHKNLHPQKGQKFGNGDLVAQMAARTGRVGTLQYLAARGVDLAKESEWGYAPIHIAAQYGQTKTVEFLKDHPGIDITRPASAPGSPSLEKLAEAHPDLAAKIAVWTAEKKAAPLRPRHLLKRVLETLTHKRN